MDLEKTLRYFARSYYWQQLYNQSKEFGDVSLLFDNIRDLSGIQLYFLQWLKIYNSIYEDLVNKESIYLDEKVIIDDIRTNAYLHYRRISRDKELVENRNKKEAASFTNSKGQIPGEMHKIEFVRSDD